MKKIKEFFEEDVCSAIVLGIVSTAFGMAVFLIPIELISSIFHFSFNTALWLHKGVVILFFSFGFIFEIAPRKVVIENITITCDDRSKYKGGAPLPQFLLDSFKLKGLLEVIKNTGGIAVPMSEGYEKQIKDAKAFLLKHGYNEKGEKIKEEY